jgi:uncharacterized glyoxalase superfamily protein PhnB
MRTNLSMPAAAIIPVLEYPDVPAAVKWLEEAFAFEVRLRIGAHRAQLQFDGGAIVVSQSSLPDAAPGSGSVMVRVEAIDAHFLRARQHGARIIRDLEDFPYGERQYTCLDPAGHSWTFSETVRNVDPTEWGGQLVSSRPNLTLNSLPWQRPSMHRPPSASGARPVRKFASSASMPIIRSA